MDEKMVFIDGSEGTTGLRIKERLRERDDLRVLTLADSERKDPERRAEALNAADIAILCLPDAAAIEAVSLVKNPDTIIIDTSTAHRTDPNWVYGFAELGGRREKIAHAKRIANPGCHASGFLALVAPLVEMGILSGEAKLSCMSITGYSGGGKKMISQYLYNPQLNSPRQYGLTQEHKHLPEMREVAGLQDAPLFCPVVSNYYSGMEVSVPLFASQINEAKLFELADGSAVKTDQEMTILAALRDVLARYYSEGLVRVCVRESEVLGDGFLSAASFAGRDDMEIRVTGNSQRILMTAIFDNLGKGASGAAIQNMNLALGARETRGLIFPS